MMGELALRVMAMRHEAEGVVSLELARPDGDALPAFTAGAHVDLHFGDGLTRSYSLLNPQDETHRWVVAVNRDRASRGGSAHVHERLRVGELVRATGPRNAFALDETAPDSVLIAGGIGITPLLCMAARLEALGRRWSLHYGARSRPHAAFAARLHALAASSTTGELHLHFDDEAGGQPLAVASIVSSAPPGSHFYACGPLPLLAAFEEATAALPREQVHLEYFTAKEAPAVEGGFEVRLARSNRSLAVPPGRTILDVLLEGGVDVPYSCLQGVCGSCETRVLEGVPDHRDLILTDSEHASHRVMMVCCSGSLTPTLVLDL